MEFAIIGSLFFVLLLSMIEAGLLIARIAVVDHAAAVVAREVYIGAIQHGGVTQEDLEAVACEHTHWFVAKCKDNITLELVPIASLDDVPDTDAVCRATNEEIEPVVEFRPGGARQVMFLRLCLTADVVTPGLPFGMRLSKDNDGKIRLISSIAFMNEPF